jgi:hypothetical protein
MHPQGSRVGNISKMAEPTEHETENYRILNDNEQIYIAPNAKQ